MHVTSMDEAIQVADKMPCLVEIGRIYGLDKMILLIQAYLLEMEDYFDFDKKMNESQLTFISQEIAAKYANLTIADINVIFRNAKSGVYGEFFNRIAPDRVLKWFSDYFVRRCAAFAEISQNTAVQDKGDNFTAGMAAHQLAKLEEKFNLKK